MATYKLNIRRYPQTDSAQTISLYLYIDNLNTPFDFRPLEYHGSNLPALLAQAFTAIVHHQLSLPQQQEFRRVQQVVRYFNVPPENFNGYILRLARHQIHISQSSLARLSRIPRSKLSRFESSHINLSPPELLRHLEGLRKEVSFPLNLRHR